MDEKVVSLRFEVDAIAVRERWIYRCLLAGEFIVDDESAGLAVARILRADPRVAVLDSVRGNERSVLVASGEFEFLRRSGPRCLSVGGAWRALSSE